MEMTKMDDREFEAARVRARERRRRMERVGRGCMANVSHGCSMGCLAVWAGLAALWGVLLAAEWGYEKWSDVRPFLAEVRPGMTEEEVLALAPRRFEVSTREDDVFFTGASMVDAGARPAKRMCFMVKPTTVFTQALSFLGGVAETAWVYFDGEGRVVGEDYSAYSTSKVKSWRKNRPWGVECGGTAGE